MVSLQSCHRIISYELFRKGYVTRFNMLYQNAESEPVMQGERIVSINNELSSTLC